MNQWEVWYANFPYEENPTIVKRRPVIILNVDTLECLSVKVTSHEVRDEDDQQIIARRFMEYMNQ